MVKKLWKCRTALNILNAKYKIMKTILIATDFSATAFNAATYAADMAQVIHANLLLFHSYQVPVTYSEVPVAVNFADLEKDAESRLDLIKSDLLAWTGNRIEID